MPVTATTAAFDGPAQIDGSRQVRETHTTPGGPVVMFYRAPVATDIAAIATARASQIAAQLADREEENNFGRDGPLALGEMTAAQFADRLRARYRASDKGETCRLAWWLLRRIAAGQITDAQCRAPFGMTLVQWTTFKTNTLTPQSNAWAAITAATGT